MTLSEFKETKFFKIIKNKYLITIMVFLVLMLFSPEHNVIYYFKLKKQLTELEGRRDDLKEKIKSDSPLIVASGSAANTVFVISDITTARVSIMYFVFFKTIVAFSILLFFFIVLVPP